MINKNNLEILIPTFNEEKNILKTIEELKCEGFINVTILDAQSTDSTVEFSKNAGCKVIIDVEKKMGFGSSCINGINQSTKEFICIFDGDNSFDPKSIHQMINMINLGYDFVFASRYLNKGKSEDDTIVTKFGNFFFTILVRILFNFNTTDVLFQFTLGKADLYRNLKLVSKDFRICTEFLIKAYSKYRCCEVLSIERKRIYGVSKVNKLIDGFKILINILYYFIIFRFLRKKL